MPMQTRTGRHFHFHERPTSGSDAIDRSEEGMSGSAKECAYLRASIVAKPPKTQNSKSKSRVRGGGLCGNYWAGHLGLWVMTILGICTRDLGRGGDHDMIRRVLGFGLREIRRAF